MLDNSFKSYETSHDLPSEIFEFAKSIKELVIAFSLPTRVNNSLIVFSINSLLSRTNLKSLARFSSLANDLIIP